MNKFDFSYVTKGDVLTLRCGGKLTVRTVEIKGGGYGIGLRFEDFLADNNDPWWFDEYGEHGNGTGGDKCPFDVVKVERTGFVTSPIERPPEEDDED